jgi:hypothetical protein
VNNTLPIIQMGPMLAASIKAYGEGSDRSMQSAAGVMGPSDLGFCQQKAVLMTKGVEQSDSTSIAAAQIGTAVHAYVAEALRFMFPNWTIDAERVTATFPSGAQISGTPDIIAPDFNAVIDVKTVDGFEWVKREGTSRNHRWQRHTYTMGAIQAGLLDPDQPLYVGNLYIDRSGKEPEPLFLFEEFDPSLTAEIDQWIGDVQYAVMHKEDGMREIPAPVCEKICSYFTVCRGGLEVHEGGEMIEDPERLAAVAMFVEGRELEKTGAQMKKEAGARLIDSNGTANVDGIIYTVRNTYVNPTTVQAFDKQGYNRLDIRKARATK